MSRFENRTLTLRDVSEASGVSEMTVSRVLRGRGDVSQATREKVLQAAKSLGYVPNKIAGALASQRVNLVAKITRDRIMSRLDKEFPGYDWSKNAGYPTKFHKSAILNIGITPHHRRSFKPVHNILYPENI